MIKLAGFVAIALMMLLIFLVANQSDATTFEDFYGGRVVNYL